jgi:glycine cleavage system H lipoate-binding protein
MPEMDGVEVTKAVKHIRPDIDVVIITGYASVDTAVETMKYGAMDYVQKPFTEDELIGFVNKILIKRQDRIQKMLRPNVHISHLQTSELFKSDEFAIPGGVFISQGHCWVNVEQDGTVKIGIDDFANKLLGKIDYIEQPNLGMNVTAGQPLFRVKQGNRSVAFNSPITGKVAKINTKLASNLDDLNITPYEKNWICSLDADSLDTELKNLKIGNSAVNLFQDDIVLCKEQIRKLVGEGEDSENADYSENFELGEFENLDDKDWYKVTSNFFNR